MGRACFTHHVAIHASIRKPCKCVVYQEKQEYRECPKVLWKHSESRVRGVKEWAVLMALPLQQKRGFCEYLWWFSFPGDRTVLVPSAEWASRAFKPKILIKEIWSIGLMGYNFMQQESIFLRSAAPPLRFSRHGWIFSTVIVRIDGWS